MRIAVVQFNAIFADVKANLRQAKANVQNAALDGAELILFPEFFASAIGFSDKMLEVARQGNLVEAALKQWSKEYQIIIGGSYIMFDGENAFNLFQLVFPNGEVFGHCKDIPTQFENCYYTSGDENNILYTPIGNIGVALCWEMIRYDTVKRLMDNADFVLSGSCWWDIGEDETSEEKELLREYNQNLATETPVVFAKLLGVPVIHASHCGKVTAQNFQDNDKTQTRQLIGATQVVDAQGRIIIRRPFDKGDGMLVCDVFCGKRKREKVEMDELSQRYWIPDLPKAYINAWETVNPKGRVYYQDVVLPYYKRHNG